MEFRELLDHLGIETAPHGHDHSRSGWLNFDCIYCSPNWSHYRMGYNIRGKYLNCWSCGRHSVAETLVQLSGKSFREIHALLKDVPGGDRVEKTKRTGLVLPDFLGPLQDPHKEYLRKRGFNWRKLVKLWEIKGIGLSDELPWRIFIPIIHNGSIVSWTTRSISDEHSGRYVSAGPNRESTDHKELLYGEDYCRHAVVLCEGPTDVWAIGPGSVCPFGTGYSRSQIEKISAYPIRAICFDNEITAQRQAMELSRSLEVFNGETFNVRLSVKDAAEALKKCPDELVELRKRFLEV